MWNKWFQSFAKIFIFNHLHVVIMLSFDQMLFDDYKQIAVHHAVSKYNCLKVPRKNNILPLNNTKNSFLYYCLHFWLSQTTFSRLAFDFWIVCIFHQSQCFTNKKVSCILSSQYLMNSSYFLQKFSDKKYTYGVHLNWIFSPLNMHSLISTIHTEWLTIKILFSKKAHTTKV